MSEARKYTGVAEPPLNDPTARTRTSAEPHPQKSETPRRKFLRFFKFLLILGILWIVFWFLDRSFPGIKPGADQVLEAKESVVREKVLFPAGTTTRVVVCGDSRMLAGFNPKVFDPLAGEGVISWNLGLPGLNRYLDELSALVERGQAPTHVLLTLSWPAKVHPSLYDSLRDDDALMNKVFPFRKLPRNAALFAILARSHGGLRTYYASAMATVDQLLDNRGYYFIEGQSHYADNRLPDDFRLDSDTPQKTNKRELDTSLAGFDRLQQLMKKGGFKVIFVPCYARKGQLAPIEYDADEAKRLAAFDITTVGPAYYLYENRYFSDPVHMNREGAELYTKQLWELLRPVFHKPAAVPATPDAGGRN
jgi:hypothetical protein